MDLGTIIQSLTAADLALLLLIAGAFIVGFFQGSARGIMFLLAWLVAFVVGVTAWQPLGDWLSRYWVQYQTIYTQMLAYLIGFVVAFVMASIVIVVFSRRAPLLGRWPFVDEVLGGILFVILFLLIIAAVMAGFDTTYGHAAAATGNDVPWITSIWDALNGSLIGSWINDAIVPLILLIFSPIIPDEFDRLATA